jgi:Mycothiol maleylpyruvate isomerase N-terminal domain
MTTDDPSPVLLLYSRMPHERGRDEPERKRLEALVERLSDDDLARPVADGWTIAAVLAHLAFWDHRAAVLVERWRKAGVGRSDADVDAINDAAKPQWLALPPRAAAEDAVRAARAADGALDAAGDELVEQIVAIGYPINVSRAAHRAEHLDEIERTLSA